jgi:hypothetical protein
MSSYIGNQVPDEPIGSGADEEGAHDQEYLHEYSYNYEPAPRTLAVARPKRGDAPTQWGRPKSADMTPAAVPAGALPTVTFEGYGIKPQTKQPSANSISPHRTSSLTQENQDTQGDHINKVGEATAKRENGDNSANKTSKADPKSTGKATFVSFVQYLNGEFTTSDFLQFILLANVTNALLTVTPPQPTTRSGPEPNRETNHISFQSPFSPTTSLHPTVAAPDRPRSRQGQSSLANVFQFNSQTNGAGSNAGGASEEGRMFFGASKLPGTIAYRRKSLANTNAITNYEADLTSRDRAKQKEAVKRLLADRVRDDWVWEWPQPEKNPSVYDTPGLENNHENERRPRLSLSRLVRSRDPSRDPSRRGSRAASRTASRGVSRAGSPDNTADRPHRMSLNLLRRSRDPSREPSPDLGPDRPRRLSLSVLRLSRDPSPEPAELEWKPRDEWLSDYSETEADPQGSGRALEKTTSLAHASPFRFETPDGVGESIQKVEDDRKRKRRKRNKEEREWNDGVRCFMERRDAWTGARHIPSSPNSPAMTRTMSNSSGEDGSPTAIDNDEEDEWEDSDTEVPIAPPLLPPTNAMRMSITPEAYNTIFDKVVLQQLTPSCPMNLSDVVRSCVHGWKRDGEWPPTGTPMEPPKAKRKPRKLSVASIFGLDKGKDDKEKEPGSPIRRGLQRLLSIGKDGDKSALPSPTTAGPSTPRSAGLESSTRGAGGAGERA